MFLLLLIDIQNKKKTTIIVEDKALDVGFWNSAKSLRQRMKHLTLLSPTSAIYSE